jgi:hypothetical protein
VTPRTWNRIAQRHVWFGDLLRDRMVAIEGLVGTDLTARLRYRDLAIRRKRLLQRMARHLVKGPPA